MYPDLISEPLGIHLGNFRRMNAKIVRPKARRIKAEAPGICS